jgi:hypothetical protein
LNSNLSLIRLGTTKLDPLLGQNRLAQELCDDKADDNQGRGEKNLLEARHGESSTSGERCCHQPGEKRSTYDRFFREQPS